MSFQLVPGVRWVMPIAPYELRWNGSNLWCSCKGFKYQRKPVRDRTCKHTLMWFSDYQPMPDLYPVENRPKPELFLLSDFNPKNPPEDLTSFWWSEKLDGVRVFYDGKDLITRGGKTVRAPRDLLLNLPEGLQLDGELWAGHNTLDRVLAAMQVGPPDPTWNQIRFMVFDSPQWSDESFEERYQRLLEQRTDHPEEPWELVVQHRVRSFGELEKRVKKVTRVGGEGVVLRHKEALYRKGRNSKMALKWKLSEFIEGVLVGQHRKRSEAAADVPGVSWVVEALENRRFLVRIYEHDVTPELVPGARVMISVRGLTKDGNPRFPQFERLILH